jgi:hypothetical protein
MSAETVNKNFITAAMAALGPGLTPDFSKFTYGLWISSFQNPNHSENGYSIPESIVEDLVAYRSPITGKRVFIKNEEGEAPKVRFFLTESLLGKDGYSYLRDFELTDRFVSGASPKIIMPDMDYAGKVYRRNEITGLTKSKSTNNNILTVSGEDWVDTNISVNFNDTDELYTYTDSNHTGYKNEVTTRYKFLYNDTKNSIPQDYSVFEIPYQLETESSLKYRISRASEPLGIYENADLTADGKAIIDYSKYKEEVSGTIDGQITYNFEPVVEFSFDKTELAAIKDQGSAGKRPIKQEQDANLTEFQIVKSVDVNGRAVFKLILLSDGDFNDIYKVDLSVERFKTRDKPPINGFVMTSYDVGNGTVTLNVGVGSGVYPRINEDGQPFGYDNLQDLIEIDQIKESEKYAQEIQIPDAGDEEDENQLAQKITDNYQATQNAIMGIFEGDKPDERPGMEERRDIDNKDLMVLTKENNIVQYYKTALPNFPLPKKIITKDFYSNYLNSGENYVVIPLERYGLIPTFVSCGDKYGVLAYYFNESPVEGAVEPVFRSVVNSTCGGLYVNQTGFCKGDSAIYDNNQGYSAVLNLKYQNGSITRIPKNGIISKSNYVDEPSYLKGVNYFYTKNYVSSFNVYPSLSEANYKTLFAQAFREVNTNIGGATSDSSYDSFYRNGASAPRIFVEREIYTKSYTNQESFELNQSILSGVYTPSDADLSSEEKEKLYCVHAFEPKSADSFSHNKPNYFYPIQDYSEEISFKSFISSDIEYSTEGVGILSFVDKDIEVPKLFRAEYVTGDSFSYDDTSNFRAWSAAATPPSNITIANQDTKSYSYHLYGYNSSSNSLSFIESNVVNGVSRTSASFSNLVVLKFIKQGLTDSVFQTEAEGITKSSMNVNVLDAAGDLLDASKVKFNIQTYDYNVKTNSETNQWVLFNKNPINNNIYGKRDAANFSEPRFFQDDEQATKDLLSNLFFFPNGPYTSKNYEGKPVYASSLNGLTDGLYENNIYIKEENQDAARYESNYVLEILNNGNIVKQKPPASSQGTVRFKDTRRLQITKIKYNFYTKDLVLIGDSGSPYSVNFNDGWEYDLQYKAKNASYGSSGSSGSSGGGASVDWTIMSKEGDLTKKTISSEYAIISPYYFSEEDLETPNFLSMVAFKTNLPLFLDDNNYEFRILKRQKLSVFSDSANVIKKTNFSPIKVSWNKVNGCSYYNIYQKDRNSNLNFLRSVPSDADAFSYVVPDVKQENVDLGVFNFGANGSNYYDIVVSGVKPSVTKDEITLSQEYEFEVGNSDFSQTKISKLSPSTNYATVNVSSPTYSQVLNFNNPETRDSNFIISPNSGGYYFVTNGATSVGFENIEQPFESYVLNKNANSCSVNGTAVATNNIAVIDGPGAPSTVTVSANPASTFDLSSNFSDGVLYLKSNIEVLYGEPVSLDKDLILINDSNADIDVTFDSVVTIEANKTIKLNFKYDHDTTTKTITEVTSYSNITTQDDEIYHPDVGFVNLNHTTGSFLAGSRSNLPVLNLHTEPLRLNNVSLEPDSFNYVTWELSSASKDEKEYFDDLKLFLKGGESEANSIFMIKDDIEIIISNIKLSIGASKQYFFLKDESIKRSVNIKITNGSSVEDLSKQNQDFKLTVNRNTSGINYSILYPSFSPDVEIKNSKEQLVLFKGDKVLTFNLKTLEKGLPAGAFVYFINKNSASVNFYKDNPDDVLVTLGPDQIARAIVTIVGNSKVVALDVLTETLSHFSFKVDPAIHLASSINILDLNFCATQISLPAASALAGKELFLICRNRFLPNKINKESVKDINSLISTTDNSTTSEINEIGDIGENSVSLRVFQGDASNPSIGRTSFLQKNKINLEDDVKDEDQTTYFYIRNKDIQTFTIKDTYNRKFKYKGKIFLPDAKDSVVIQSFDSEDRNSQFTIKDTNSINFDYDPDGYLNGRLQVDKPKASDAIVYSRESETGSVTKVFPNALANGQFLINFAYDTVTATINGSPVTLKKNRVVCNSGSNYVYPIYNNKEFFIALSNTTRTNTKIGGGTVFYYIINANEVDVDTIVLPDISASISFVIKNISGRPYQIKTLSGVLVHTLLPSSANNQKLFTYTGAPYTVTTDSINFDSDVNFGFDHGDQKNHVPTSIKSANQYIELDQSHPLLALFDVDGAIKDAKTIFKDTDFDLTINSSTSKYRISDVYSTVTASNLSLIYCYGRKPLILDNLTKYIVNDFYLFVEHGPVDGRVAVDNEQFYLPSDLTEDGVLNTGAQDLNIIDENHIDLTRFFENQTQIAALPNVIFIPITKYSSKFYLPNLQAKVPSTVSGSFVELSSLLAGKKILFVNLIESDSSGYNSIYNYSNATTTNLQDVNSIALFSVSGGSWTKDTSSLPQVKKVFATLKNIKGIGDTSNTEVTKGKEFIYLPNFNRFNLSLQSFEDRSFRDFYVFNSCKYTIYINSDATLLSSAAFTRIAKDQTSGNFIGIGLDQGSSSVFSVIEKNYAEGKTPEDLDKLINVLYPNLQFTTKIKLILKDGNTTSTRLFEYGIDNKAKETNIINAGFGVLDLDDLIPNDADKNLFIYGSSQVNNSGDYFDSYPLNILGASNLQGNKFYIYNNTPYYLEIYFDTGTTAGAIVPSKRLIEITKSGVNFLGVHEKGKYYISNKTKNVNYLFKQSLSVFLDGIFDYADLIGTHKTDTSDLNILITNTIRNEKYVPYGYYNKDGQFLENVFNNFSVVDVLKLESMDLNPNRYKDLIKPNISVVSNGHYLLENNNNDITVTVPNPGEIFLVNNCPEDIYVNVVSSPNYSVVLYRNTVLVLKPGPSAGVEFRYLKKAKSRDEFYCIFNPKTVISTQREITLFEKIIRNDDLFPILDDNLIEQKSYVKLLSKNGVSSKIGLFLRDYFNGKDIPTDSPSDVVGYEVGIGHETIYKFLFFDPSESTYTLPGIQSGVEYEVVINQSFFDNINIADSANSFTRETEQPYVKYKGVRYNNGEVIVGGNVSTYEIKYPNFVTLYKIVKEIDRPFEEADPKGEEGGVDSSVTVEEPVVADAQGLFNAKIREEYNRLANSIISWLPQNQSAFWLNSNYSDDVWTIESINNNVNPFTIISGDKTITFTSYKIKKTGLKTPLFSYNYSLFSALNPIRKMTNNSDLTIALDGALKPTQIQRIKLLLGQEQLRDDILFPNNTMEIGGFYIDNFFNANDNSTGLPAEIEQSEILVNIKISKLKDMPDVKFDDFSKSSVIKIINRKK